MIYTLGDSIIKGVYLNKEGRYRIKAQPMLEKALDSLSLESKNYGVFGATVDKGLEFIERKKDAFLVSSPVLVLFGGNDCNHSWGEIAESPEKDHGPKIGLEDFGKKYERILRELIDLELKPIALSLPPLNHQSFFSYLSEFFNGETILSWLGKTENIFHWQESYDKRLRDIAKKLRVPLLDLRRLILEEKNYKDYICRDGMHINPRGQDFLAEKLAQPLAEKLKEL